MKNKQTLNKSLINLILSLLIVSSLTAPVWAEEGGRSDSVKNIYKKLEDVSISDYNDVSRYSKKKLLLCPFEIDKKQSKESLYKWFKELPYAPNDLSKKASIEDFKGIYFPCWSFNTNASADYDIYYQISKDGNTQNKHCTDAPKSTFNNYLTQALTAVPKGTVKNKLTSGFSKKYSAHISSILKFQKSKYILYNQKKAAEYAEWPYQINLQTAWNDGQKQIDAQMLSSFTQGLKAEVYTVKSQKIDFENTEFARVLVPIWIYCYTYEGKYYFCAVNGQNGAVSGDSPESVFKKNILFTILFFSIIAVIFIGLLASIILPIYLCVIPSLKLVFKKLLNIEYE